MTLVGLPLGDSVGQSGDGHSPAPTPAYSPQISVSDLFEDVVGRFSRAPAVRSEHEVLTYRQVDDRANQIAHFLRRHGVSAGDRVGVFLDRSANLIVAQLAILKAGAVYVPIDINAPKDRVAFFLSDAGIRLVLSSSESVELTLPQGVTRFDLDVEAERIAAESTRRPPSAATGGDPAYVMYTSGSTGTPKGVEIPHRGIVRLVRSQTYFPAGPDTCTLLLASPGFDGTTYEIYSALLNGGSVAVFADRFVDHARLRHVIRSLGVTNAWFSTGLFNQIVDRNPNVLQTLRHVLVGGEALSAPHMVRAKAALPSVTFGNGYGPTECTTLAVAWDIDEPSTWGCDTVPLGFPINNTECHIVDESLRPLGEGEVGELLLGGDGLATGYLNRPDLTAERFIRNPFSADPESRLYRTGDRCYWLPNGMIAYVGRNDDQVKLNGFRVELGEVEATIRHCAGVKNAAAVVHDFRSGVRALAACVTLEPHVVWSEDGLRDVLARELPPTMLPGRIFRVDALPLTLNGKVDRRHVAKMVDDLFVDAMTTSARQHEHDQLTPRQRSLLELWQSTLNDDAVDVDSDFFRVGGDSLLAAELESAIEKQLSRSIPAGTVHRFSTPRILAAQLERGGSLTTSVKKTVALSGEGHGAPVFFMPEMGGFGGMPKALAAALHGRRSHYDRLTFKPITSASDHTATLETIAAELVEQIRSVRPSGPYMLMGYSFGGYLAFEVARQFEAAGDLVERVILWDAVPDTDGNARSVVEVAGVLTKRLLSPATWRDERWLRNRITFARGAARSTTARLMRQSKPAQDVELESNEYLATQLIRKFRPQPYGGRVSLLWCSAPSGSVRSRDIHPTEGWGNSIREEHLELIEFACHHNDVLQSPHLDAFVRATIDVLERDAIAAK